MTLRTRIAFVATLYLLGPKNKSASLKLGFDVYSLIKQEGESPEV